MCGGGGGQCGSHESDIPEDGSHWAGYAFESGPVPDDAAGVFVLAASANGRLQALQVGEGLNLAAAIALVPAEAAARAEKIFWMRQGNPRLRSHIERILEERYLQPQMPPSKTPQLWEISR